MSSDEALNEDAAFSSGDSLPPPEALLAWYLLSLAELEISDGLNKKAKSELQDRSDGVQMNLDIETVEEYLNKFYQGI